MSEGNLRRAVQNLKKKAVMSQNAFFFKIIIVFFFCLFFLGEISFLLSKLHVSQTVCYFAKTKKLSAAGMISIVTKSVLPDL